MLSRIAPVESVVIAVVCWSVSVRPEIDVIVPSVPAAVAATGCAATSTLASDAKSVPIDGKGCGVPAPATGSSVSLAIGTAYVDVADGVAADPVFGTGVVLTPPLPKLRPEGDVGKFADSVEPVT